MKSLPARVSPWVLLALIVSTGLSAFATRKTSSSPAPAARRNNSAEPARERAGDAYGKLPLSFEANRGQADQKVDFISRGKGYGLFLSPNEAVLVLHRGAGGGAAHAGGRQAAIRMKVVGANPSPHAEGLGELPGKANYFRGRDPKRWSADVPTYSRVRYAGVYPGVDLVYYGNQRQLEYDFVIAPGADPGAVRLRFEGADRVEIDSRGDLVLHVAGGQVRQPKPVVYQQIGSGRREVEGAYTIRAGGEVGFRIGDYDAGAELVIDPVLVYSAYLGGVKNEEARAVAVDAEGNAYVTGFTVSLDFPVSAGAFQKTTLEHPDPPNYYGDAFVTKINPSGTGIVYSTYIGGSVAGETGTGIDVDAEGNAYVVGATGGGAAPRYPNDFPIVNAFDPDPDFYEGPFVLKLNPAGSSLVYSTYLGSGSANGLAVNKATGELYVVGGTSSATFPVTPGALKTTNEQNNAAGWAVKFDASGKNLVYGTYLPGVGFGPADVTVDAQGNAYISGATTSQFFPVTPDAAQSTCTGCEFRRPDAFLMKLNPTATSILYATYLGGSLNESGNGVALDAAGNIYVAGATASGALSQKPFAVTPGSLNNTSQGSGGGFVVKYSPAGVVIYSAIFGIGGATELAVDAAGNAHVTGSTRSDAHPMVDAFASARVGGTDYAFVTTLNPAGTSVLFSTLFGIGIGRHVVADNAGNVYVAGETYGYSEMPLAGPLAVRPAGYSTEAFVAKIAVTGAASKHAAITGQLVTTDGSSNSGVQIKLGGSQTGIVRTDSQGRYSFPVKPGGTYTIEPVYANWNFKPRTQTLENVTADRQAETIYAGANIAPAVRFLSPAQNATYTAPATITLRAEASDPDGRVESVKFYANNGVGLLFVDTEAPFEFEWKDVPANAQWAVQASVVDDTGAERITWVDFAVDPPTTPTPAPTYSIGGAVRDAAGSPLAGVAVTLSGSQSATAQTDAGGNYSFTGLAAGGSYTVTPTLANYTFASPSLSFNDLSGNRTGDFAATRNTHAVSGRIRDDNNAALGGVTVTLSGAQSATTTTDAAGNYSFANLPAGGAYTVTPSLANYGFAPTSRTLGNLSGDQVADFAASLNTHAISGRVADASNNALAGVTVALSGARSASTLTDANGAYSFASLPAGASYTVTPSLADHTFAPPSRVFNNLQADATGNFAGTLNTHAITGRVADGAGNALAGVTVALSGSQSATARTDAAGNYSFANLPAGGTYAVTPSLADYVFTPQSRTFDNLQAVQAADFNAASVPATIQVSAAGYSAGEGGGSVSVAVTRAVNTSTAVGVSYSTAGGSATAGADFAATAGMLSFAPGETAKTVTVQLINDDAVEGDESFTLSLGDPTGGASLGPITSVKVTISDDDTCNYTVSPDGPPEFPAAGGQGSFQMIAPAGCSWRAQAVAPWIVITSGAAGTGTGAVTFTIAQNLGAARAGQILRTDDAFVNVRQAGAAVTFAIDAATSSDAGEGRGHADITLTRTGDPSQPASVTFQTVDDPEAVPCATINGRAYARCDYATTVETITWAAGDSQPKTVRVPLLNDSRAEGPETFRVRLADPRGGVILGPAVSTVTIQDDDAAEGVNPIRGTPFFVRMHYLDFLSREPEAGEPWSDVLNKCADADNTDPNAPSVTCDRLLVSESFFRSQEFYLKGLYSYLFYRVAFGRHPGYEEITPDMRSLAGATGQEVFANRAAYAAAVAERAEFAQLYGQATNQQYVEALLGRFGLQQITTEDPADFEGAAQVTLTKQQLVDALNSEKFSRAQVLRAVVQSSEVDAAEYLGAFVSMQYYGYLRRAPEQSGYDAWLRVIRQDPNNVRRMVDGFVNSQEYRLRFGQP